MPMGSFTVSPENHLHHARQPQAVHLTGLLNSVRAPADDSNALAPLPAPATAYANGYSC